MLKTVKKTLLKTPVGTPLRSIVRALRKWGPSQTQSEWGIRVERDEQNIQRLLRMALKKNSNCIDVGAHNGSFVKMFLDLSPEGSHYAFEPLPHMAKKLRQEFPTVKVFECALDEENCNTSFYYVPEMPAWSGLRKQRYPVQAHPQLISVEKKRLDDIIPNDARIDFIKIDVEGGSLVS